MKTPPSNIPAEESILAGCMLDYETAVEASTILKPCHFYKEINQRIFEAICTDISEKITPDATTVRSRLKSDKTGEVLYGILENPFPTSLDQYARIVIDSYTARQAIRICQEIQGDVLNNSRPIGEIVNDLQNSSLTLGADGKESFTTMRELTEESIDRYEALKDQKITPGIKTGFTILDYLTGGLKGSKLIIIAARPAIGKTAFMCNLAENIARHRNKVGIFELEMDKEELDDRWFSSLTGINTVRLSTPPIKKEHEINKSEWEKIVEAAGLKYDWPIIIDDSGNLSIDELKRRCRKMYQLGVEVIFIDQLSEIRGDKRKSLFESNTEIVEELGRLKKELRIPIVLLAQLNRQLESREDKEPRLSDLKNTGMLEEKSDMVLLGYRKHVYTELVEDENHAQWHLAKHRGGPIRKIQMRWEPKQAKFQNIAREE